MQTFEITVREITFLVESEDVNAAIDEVEGTLAEYAHDWEGIVVS